VGHIVPARLYGTVTKEESDTILQNASF
jgi:hypothetical protein